MKFTDTQLAFIRLAMIKMRYGSDSDLKLNYEDIADIDTVIDEITAALYEAVERKAA